MSKASFANQIAEMRKKAEDGTNRKEETELLADIEKIREARAKGEDVEAGSEQESQNEQADENTKRVTQATEKATEDDTRTSEDDSKQAAEQDDKSDGDESLTVSEQLDLFQKELELRDVKLEKIEARAQKWETLAQRRAGELGHLRQELGSGRGQQKADTADTDNQEDIWAELNDETATEDKRSPSQGSTFQLTEFEEEALTNARQRVLSDFLTSHDDLYVEKDGEKALDPAFTAVLTGVRDDYVDELASRSPKRVRQATAALLREARAAYREQKLEESITETRKRRAIVSTKARERKQAMEATESSAPAKAKETSKNFEDLSPEEMRKVLAKDKRRSIYNHTF